MVALFTDAITGDAKPIHRTAINAAGEKVGRMMLGPTAGCVIRLWPDECLTDGLVIETVLAAATNIVHLDTHLFPAWALTTAGLMASMPVIAGIETLTILVDADTKDRAGQTAASRCATRWNRAGREVELPTPARQPPIRLEDYKLARNPNGHEQAVSNRKSLGKGHQGGYPRQGD
jgi:hypothetical protein